MKKFLLSILCLFCVVGISAQTNIASNPGFENWEGEAAIDWAGPIGHNATVSQSADAHTGNYSIAVAGNANSNKRLASKSYTLAAGTYTFSVYVKANGNDTGYCRLGYVSVVDGKAGTYTYESASASATTAEWTERVYEFTLAEETTIALIVMNNKNGGGASFLVDDVTLTNGEATEGGEGEGGDENEGETDVTYKTIAEVLAAGAGEAATKGTVVATYARGFLLSDETGTILVYLNAAPAVVAGDAVTVSGNTSLYGGILQFATGSTVEKTGTATVTHPAVTVMDGAALDAFIAAPAVKYVEYTGTLTINNNYYNVAVEGAATAIGSIQYPQDAIKANLTNGAVVKVTGYTIGVSSSKYVNTMAVKVETIGGEDPETPTETQEYTVTEALAAYVDGQQIPAIVTGYIVGAVNSAPETGSQFGAEATIATNILISDNPDTNDYTECLIVQLPKGDIRSALNLVDNPGNYKKQVKITGSVEKYFNVAGLKTVTAYELTGTTGIENVKGENGKVKTIFDLTGRRVENITAPGIYIVNGKKVLVK